METTISLGSNGHIVGEMTTGKIVDQQFVAKTKCVLAIEFKVGTYKRKNIGNILEISILDDANNVIGSKVVNPRSFYDNRMNPVFIGCNVKPNGKYVIRIKSLSGSKGRSVTFIYGEKQHDCNFFINESEMNGELCCNIVFLDREIAEIKKDEKPKLDLSLVGDLTYADELPKIINEITDVNKKQPKPTREKSKKKDSLP